MKHIGEKLTKHKDALSVEEDEIRAIAETIFKISGIQIGMSEVKTNRTIIQITTSPLKRQKILMYKKLILDTLTTKKNYTRIH